jgi:predicted phosphodiesterase
MENFNILTRRSFVGGVSVVGALAIAPAFSAPKGSSYGKRRLRVGVLSDVHVRVDAASGRIVSYSDDKSFVHALEYFRDQKVDAVMITGDITDYGKLSEMQIVADDWFKVFPDDRLPDGKKVERLFVNGNHDWDCFLANPEWALRSYGASEKSAALKNVMQGDMAKNWEKFWHEPYEHFYMKKVKGYTFFGAHWMDPPGVPAYQRYFGAKAFVEKHRADIDPAKPFFYFQHPHPKDTLCSFTRFHDNGGATEALKPFPNAIAISGHSHYSITDERSIWQGEFTSVNAGCMRFTEPPRDSRKPAGYENSRSAGRESEYDPGKLMPLAWPDWTGRQGMVMDVYDGAVVFRRRDFYNDLSLGDDWVVPTGPGAAKPFEFKTRAASSRAPGFAKSAKLEVKRVKASTRGSDPGGKGKVEKDCFEITVPQALAVKGARAVDYEIEVESGGKRTHSRFVLDHGFNHSLENASRQLPVKCPVAVDTLPAKGEFRFVVTPMGYFGRRGRPLKSERLKV